MQDRFDELRARAERILEAESIEARTEVKQSVSELVEELQTYQIELELQNKELQVLQVAMGASEARYRELFNFAPVTYIIFDRDGLVHDINATGLELLNVPRERILQKPFWLYVHPEHRDQMTRHIDVVHETEQEAVCELELQRKDDSQLWARLHSVPHQGRNGEERVRTALIDITEHRELEHELIAAREEAVQATQAQRAFLSNMSHEIRTPLTSVIGYAEALGEMVSTGQKREFAQSITSSGRRLLDTLNSVLDYTRIQNQDDDIPLERVNVAEQVREYARVMRDQAENKGLHLAVEIDRDEIWASLHGDYLGRVLNNLMSNAIKYTEEGRVTVRVLASEDEVEIGVEDTGVGIKEDLLDRIFEPFLQAEFGPHRQHEGVGLGLAITKRLVACMNGTIRVTSEAGAGSCFHVSFPRLADEPPTPESNNNSDEVSPVQEYAQLLQSRILVVEDNKETRELVRLFLKGAAHVAMAATGKEAVAHMEAALFDAVLLDINLGEKRTGLELIEDLREMDTTGALAVVAFTAYALPGDRERFLDAGFDGYVQKPFTRRQLLLTLNQVLEEAS